MPNPNQPTPTAPDFDLSAVVQRLMEQRQAETAEAQQAAAGMRASNASGAIASALGGPEVALRLRQQQIEEAKQPITDVVQRHEARLRALDEAARQGQVAGQSWELKQQLRNYDATDPAAVAARETARRMNLPVTDDMSLNDLARLSPATKAIADFHKTKSEGEQAAAAAQKTGVETGLAQQAAPGQRAKTAAETTGALASAEKAAAEAAQTRSLTGDSALPPGWKRTGTGVTADELKQFREDEGASRNFGSSIDELQKLIGDTNWVADPEKRAEIQPRLHDLLVQVKQKAKLKDMAFLDKMIPDPTKITAGNITGLSNNRARLEAMKEADRRELEQRWGNRFAPAGESKPGVSADDAAALDWAKKHPSDPRSSKILIRLRGKGALANNG